VFTGWRGAAAAAAAAALAAAAEGRRQVDGAAGLRGRSAMRPVAGLVGGGRRCGSGAHGALDQPEEELRASGVNRDRN
jgi:hypothetical protein